MKRVSRSRGADHPLAHMEQSHEADQAFAPNHCTIPDSDLALNHIEMRNIGSAAPMNHY